MNVPDYHHNLLRSAGNSHAAHDRMLSISSITFNRIFKLPAFTYKGLLFSRFTRIRLASTMIFTSSRLTLICLWPFTGALATDDIQSAYTAPGAFPTSIYKSYWNDPTATSAQPQPVISDPATVSTHVCCMDIHDIGTRTLFSLQT